jgi:hypothetical protein
MTYSHRFKLAVITVSNVICPASFVNLKSDCVLSFEILIVLTLFLFCDTVEKSKAVPLQAWSGPEASRKLRFPDVLTTALYGGKFVSLRHRPPLPQEILLVLISVRG